MVVKQSLELGEAIPFAAQLRLLYQILVFKTADVVEGVTLAVGIIGGVHEPQGEVGFLEVAQVAECHGGLLGSNTFRIGAEEGSGCVEFVLVGDVVEFLSAMQ